MAQQTNKEIWYVGTYSEAGSKGIYVLEFDRNFMSFEEIQTVHDKKNPTFLTVHPSKQFLYAAYREGENPGDKNGTIISYRIDSHTGQLSKINEVSSAGASPCHVSVDPTGEVVFVSNYQGGNLASYKVREDGGLHPATSFIQHEGSGPVPDRQAAPHMHSMIPSLDGNFVYASDLGTDKIMTYKVDRNTGNLSPASRAFVRSEPGAGPRHLTLHREIPFAYSVEELSNTVAIYEVNQRNGRLKPKGRVEMLNPNFQSDKNSAADIHISVDGKWLYASNRGQDNLAIYRINGLTGMLQPVGHEPSGGAQPRNFKVDARGGFIYVANMESDNVVVFNHQPVTGKIVPSGTSIQIPRAVCVEQLFLN